MIVDVNVDKYKNLVLAHTEGLQHIKIFKRKILFSYPSVLTYVLGAQKNRLIETLFFFSTHNMFWMRNNTIYFLVCTL